MTPYKSKSGKQSGVTAFHIGKDFIIVQFNNSEKYKYTYNSAGKQIVDNMKSLALSQKGLSTFIAQKKPDFE